VYYHYVHAIKEMYIDSQHKLHVVDLAYLVRFVGQSMNNVYYYWAVAFRTQQKVRSLDWRHMHVRIFGKHHQQWNSLEYISFSRPLAEYTSTAWDHYTIQDSDSEHHDTVRVCHIHKLRPHGLRY
jgi:hypothetical protein